MNYNQPHKILGINKDANLIEIKNKYKELVKIFHPDKYKGSKLYANQQFARINQAYETMISPQYQRTKKNSYQRGVFYPNRGLRKKTNLVNTRVRRQPGQPQVLCNGTVLCSGNFHPRNLSYDMLKKMRENL